MVEPILGDARSRACYLAAEAPNTAAGSWLQAMPVPNCGLKLDDEAVRVAVGLRLGLNLCLPYIVASVVHWVMLTVCMKSFASEPQTGR
jgi:hypothetical protein